MTEVRDTSVESDPTNVNELTQHVSLSSINPAPLPPPALHSVRLLHSIDIGSFLTDLRSSQLISDPPKSLGPLLSAYRVVNV